MERSVGIMADRIMDILGDNNPSMALFGSVVLNDFKLGWSDIDFICLTERGLSAEQAGALLNLRQALTAEHKGNPYFRLFEGGFISRRAFVNHEKDTVVYWGTRGQRITDGFALDPFAAIELLYQGRTLCGSGFAGVVNEPSKQDIIKAIRAHYDVIRAYARVTEESITSAGWLLDIARGLYTLKTMEIIAKTKAGEWALSEGLCPEAEALERALTIRNNPLQYKEDAGTKQWCGTLGPCVQRFADVLEKELRGYEGVIT